MKTENNKTNQQKFNALYWGQEVAKTSGYEKLKTVSDIIYRNNGMSSISCTEYLELTPLSQITDEDANFLSRLLYSKHMVKRAFTVLSNESNIVSTIKIHKGLR